MEIAYPVIWMDYPEKIELMGAGVLAPSFLACNLWVSSIAGRRSGCLTSPLLIVILTFIYYFSFT
jgi:hypothetical protein